MKKPNKSDLLKLSKSQLMEKYVKRFMGSILKSPGKRIPAISNFKCKTQDFNVLLQEIGIDHKLPAELTFTGNANRKYNKYMEHQIGRLRLAAEQKHTDKFGLIAMACLKNSRSFRLSAINHVIPNGGFGLSIGRLHQINRGVNGIFKELPDEIAFKRVYIPKKNQKWRPLGVPTVEGRIALHMMNNMIQLGFEKDILPGQNAYIAGRGCLTAGQQVIQKAISAKNIYETDIRGFFDNVHLNYIEEILDTSRMKKRFMYGMMNLNHSHPKLPKEQLVDESYHIEAQDTESKIKQGEPLDPHAKMMKPVYEFIEANGGELTLQLMKEDNCESLEEGVQLQGALFDSFKPAKVEGLSEGVPQGSPTSPFLAILAIRGYLTQNPKVDYVNYADDQIFFSNENFIIKDDPEHGIRHAEEKCGGVKKDGVGLKELKFLGLIYNGNKPNELRSETRSERKERIHNTLLELGEELEYDPEEKYLEKIAEKNFFGFVLSCLYNGTWSPTMYPTKERKVNNLSLMGKYSANPTMSSGALSLIGSTLKMRNCRRILMGKS